MGLLSKHYFYYFKKQQIKVQRELVKYFKLFGEVQMAVVDELKSKVGELAVETDEAIKVLSTLQAQIVELQTQISNISAANDAALAEIVTSVQSQIDKLKIAVPVTPTT